eukprot:12415615-Karenia_brevis.AAC.1
MSAESREALRKTCDVCETRIQIVEVGNQKKFWLQSEHVSKAKGGFVWTAQDDGSVWMNLGNRNVSSVCARIVQISYGMSREQILRALEVFGD